MLALYTGRLVFVEATAGALARVALLETWPAETIDVRRDALRPVIGG